MGLALGFKLCFNVFHAKQSFWTCFYAAKVRKYNYI